jgi:hypothetical protein
LRHSGHSASRQGRGLLLIADGKTQRHYLDRRNLCRGFPATRQTSSGRSRRLLTRMP